HEPRRQDLEQLGNVGLHPSLPKVSSAARSCALVSHQPENPSTGAVFAPAWCSWLPEIQIAWPFTLEKSSHQRSATGSARRPLASSQIAIARCLVASPPPRSSRAQHHTRLRRQARSSSGAPRCAISQSRIPRIAPSLSYRKFPVR